MASKKKSRAAKSAVEKVVKMLPRKSRARGKPFEKGNEWRFPKGVSGNPSGRPKLLGESYAEVLAMEDPATGLTLAQLLARNQFQAAMNGNDRVAHELRVATEGETIHTPGTQSIQVVIDR